MYALRDKVAAEPGIELLVHKNPEAERLGINPFDHGPLHTDMWKTEGLKQALDKLRFRRGVRRRPAGRGEEPRQGACVQLPRQESPLGSEEPASRAVVALQCEEGAQGKSIRVFPLSNWTELDIWQYIYSEGIEIVPLYLAAPRPTVERDGTLLMVDDGRFRLEPGERPVERSVRFRTLGCYPLTGAIESEATTLAEVIQEMLVATTSEREGRIIDKDGGAASMEKKKQEGYF